MPQCTKTYHLIKYITVFSEYKKTELPTGTLGMLTEHDTWSCRKPAKAAVASFWNWDANDRKEGSCRFQKLVWPLRVCAISSLEFFCFEIHAFSVYSSGCSQYVAVLHVGAEQFSLLSMI